MERKLRFLMLNWRDPENPASGGAERVSLAYLSALSSRGHDVWWFANAYPGCEQESSVDGVRINEAVAWELLYWPPIGGFNRKLDSIL
jgi:hypothetical protein